MARRGCAAPVPDCAGVLRHRAGARAGRHSLDLPAVRTAAGVAAVDEALARACNIPNPFNVCSIVHISRLALLILLTAPSLAAAQAPGASSLPADDPLRFVMPTITVTAQKEPADRQKVPVSVTAVTRETIDQAGIRIVSEAAIHAPNTFFTEW